MELFSSDCGQEGWFKTVYVDFRTLNQVKKKKKYPLPVIDDILALLEKNKLFYFP